MIRRVLTILLVGIATLTMAAQDIITLTDGRTVAAKVTEITETSVKYKRADNPSGPTYTLALNKIDKITYENGTVEEYNATQVVPVGPQLQVETLERGRQSSVVITDQSKADDRKLLNLYSTNPYVLREKASKYRKIAWIGGPIMMISGVVIAVTVSDRTAQGSFIAPLCVGVGGGIIWTTCWTIAANNKLKKARAAESYSAALFEGEIMNFGDKSLNASVNVIGNNLTNTRSYGVGLSYNF